MYKIGPIYYCILLVIYLILSFYMGFRDALYIVLAIVFLTFRFNDALRQYRDAFDNMRMISYKGLKLENKHCSVDIKPDKKACYIQERESETNNYRSIKIKNSYKTNDLYSGIVDFFDDNTTYDNLKELTELFNVEFIETSYKDKKNRNHKKIIEEPQEPVQNDTNPSMPVLKVQFEDNDNTEASKDKDIKQNELKRNEERRIDL